MTADDVPKLQIRALHTADTVTVYQAYRPEIGLPAARDGKFPSSWSRDRMTWIKPSFLWMMYRCGWARKEGQEVVLAVEIRREGFDWALRNAVLSHYERQVHPDKGAWKQQLKESPVRAQWDPERDVRLRPLPYRSLQLGLSGEAARRYADEWLVGIRNVTPLARTMSGSAETAALLMPVESPYPIPKGARLTPREGA
ncbi:hypothetical protein GCM10010329_08240 [Streptomyces spiroverticillatus]|uniref:DUF4291 family protein n=1 Tax=Streptomyces finlayi TaxID=67296 RepID=A0A918WT71_9ACTN|nr:DUF4291 domain-containing protein [Streptomyces finlayi]GGZ90077.1 hypothetical protein GCM10010329_08240 [Streptomyces spiroverticillatus]GHC80870.1 hypothetical protein GCM10010334_08230 [Streptomyces finlayi]